MPLSSLVVAPANLGFNACLQLTCYNQFNAKQFDNVSLVYFADDANSARKLMLNDAMFADAFESLGNSSVLKGVVVDSSSSWGGFPEDLADNAKRFGFDLLILQEYGDEEYNCGIGAAFSNENRCPIPIFRVPSTLQEQLKSATTVNLVNHGVWSYTMIAAKVLGVIQLLVFLGLFWATLYRLVGLGAPKSFNLGILVCYVSLTLGILLFTHMIRDLGGYDGTLFIGFSGFYVNAVLIGNCSLISTYLISMQFHRSLLEANGMSAKWKNPKVALGIALITLINVLFFGGGILTGIQVYGIAGVYSIVFVMYFLGRLGLGIYFLWGYVHVIKILQR
jgi:hypothetical protein